MQIQFEQVIPFPLQEMTHQSTSVWGSDFLLRKGENVIVNAISGKGKTTFTHLLAGIRKDFHGCIKYNTRDITTYSPDEWAFIRKEKLSFVFQDLQLFEELTVAENLDIKNQLNQLFSSVELKEMAHFLSIDEKWDTPCGQLSLGQQQRVAIIRALSQPFEWLIMDEPFSHLDPKNTERAVQLIQREVTSRSANILLTSLDSFTLFNFQKELYL